MSGRKRLLLLALVACVLVGCRSSSRHREPGRVYDTNNKFSIVPPEGWVSKNMLPGCFMLYMGPKEGEFAVNFNVNVVQYGGTPKQALPVVKQTLARSAMGYRCMDEGFLAIDGRESLFISSAFDMPAGRLQNLQYQILTGKRGYTITFTAPQSVFQKYRPIFEKCGLSARVDD